MKLFKKAAALVVIGMLIKKLMYAFKSLSNEDEGEEHHDSLQSKKRSLLRELKHMYYKLYYHTH